LIDYEIERISGMHTSRGHTFCFSADYDTLLWTVCGTNHKGILHAPPPDVLHEAE
jgi:hypothetical protein